MRFRSENSVFKFLRRGMDEASESCVGKNHVRELHGPLDREITFLSFVKQLPLYSRYH